MSRWVESFQNHPFSIIWKDLKDKLELCNVNDTVVLSVEEIARLKKVITFIDNGIEGIDPELFNIAILNTLNSYATQCRDQVNHYNANNNIGHIQNANGNADSLFTTLRPYFLAPDKLKKSLLASINAYTTEVNKHLNNITDTKSEYIKVKEYRADIEEYYNLLFQDDDENESIKLHITTLFDRAEQQTKEINGFYNETLIDQENESTKTVISEAKKDILRDTKEANEKLIDVSAKIEDLDKFYINIFGSEDEDGKRTGGLKKEIEQRIISLDDFKKSQEESYKNELNKRLEDIKTYEEEQKNIYNKLHLEIESLIPGATSTGLALAYQEMKDSFEKPIENWNKIFLGSIITMFIATLFSFLNFGVTTNDTYTFVSFVKTGDITNTMNSLLFKLPLYAPLIWIAIFASKRRSENQRLQQEYAHKEALSKSYVGYKMQIDELEQTDKELLTKLLNSSIDTVAYNASESLDKKHGDGTPATEVIKAFVDQVVKLKK